MSTGGQAFPVWELNGQGKPEMTEFGMTLRDYFAAKAMAGMIATPWPDYNDRQEIAKRAWSMADAMLWGRD